MLPHSYPLPSLNPLGLLTQGHRCTLGVKAQGTDGSICRQVPTPGSWVHLLFPRVASAQNHLKLQEHSAFQESEEFQGSVGRYFGQRGPSSEFLLPSTLGFLQLVENSANGQVRPWPSDGTGSAWWARMTRRLLDLRVLLLEATKAFSKKSHR